MRVAPDDEIYRVNTVWLGPRGLTFPWTARYLAYSTWLVLLLVILLFKALTPLTVGVPPVWEVCIATLATYALMGLVDHERTVASVWQTFRNELTAPRSQITPRPLQVAGRVTTLPARGARTSPATTPPVTTPLAPR